MHDLIRRLVPLAAALAFGLSGAAQAATAKPDFSGYWRFDADAFNPPPAQLTPGAARKRDEIVSKKAAGSEDYARKWCTYAGTPALMQVTAPIEIRHNWREVVVVAPVRSEPRHIYIDPRVTIDLDSVDPATNGFAKARWQGNALIAETRGFSDNGVLVLPGGGLKSSNSRLREVWRMTGPDTLEVTSTWTDPTTLRRPLTYTQQFNRVKEQVWFAVSYCSPVRAMREAGLPLPPGEGGD